VRGKKLLAWELPPIMQQTRSVTEVKGSQVGVRQQQLFVATRAVLDAVAEDVRLGLLETVGLHCRPAQTEKCAIILELAPGTNAAQIAEAIDLENVEAWCVGGQVHVAIGPWYSTKDVDQVVLAVTKVIHVLLGLHAAPVCESPATKTLSQRFLTAATQVLTLQRHYADQD
jgi:hypothetical protein